MHFPSPLRRLTLPLAVLALAAACGPPSRPSVVWISLDTTRADHLGCYGYFRDTSPNLDRLAAESIVFERAIAPMATTLPTHLSVLTSAHPREHGVVGNLTADKYGYIVSENLTSFASVLADQGYATGAFVSAASLKSESGIRRGFQRYAEPEGGMRPADETNALALEWLAGVGEVPIFLWVHYFDPHAPYEPRPPFAGTFQTDDGLRDYLDSRRFAETSLTLGKDEVETVPSINLYDDEILFMDSELGRLLEALEADPRFDGAPIVVMGDHGEGLGQHARPRHGHVWDEQLRVPLLMRLPGREPGRFDGLTSSMDIFPTLLGSVPLPGFEDYLAEATGVDVLNEFDERRAVFSVTSLRYAVGEEQVNAITSSRWKYVLTENGVEQLFDLREDPYELNDLSQERPGPLNRMRAELGKLSRAYDKRAEEIGPPRTTSMEDSLVDELRALGYVEDE